MPVNSRAGEGADPWQNLIPLLFKVAYSAFRLLLILCQVLNAEGKIQLLQQPLGTCLEGDITRNTKNRENISCSYWLDTEQLDTVVSHLLVSRILKQRFRH